MAVAAPMRVLEAQSVGPVPQADARTPRDLALASVDLGPGAVESERNPAHDEQDRAAPLGRLKRGVVRVLGPNYFLKESGLLQKNPEATCESFSMS